MPKCFGIIDLLKFHILEFRSIKFQYSYEFFYNYGYIHKSKLAKYVIKKRNADLIRIDTSTTDYALNQPFSSACKIFNLVRYEFLESASRNVFRRKINQMETIFFCKVQNTKYDNVNYCFQTSYSLELDGAV